MLRKELDSEILVDPFQLGIFFDSTILTAVVGRDLWASFVHPVQNSTDFNIQSGCARLTQLSFEHTVIYTLFRPLISVFDHLFCVFVFPNSVRISFNAICVRCPLSFDVRC